MAKRILLLSASVGSGHTRAAQAVEAALRELEPGATVKHIDVLELTSATFRRLYSQAYFDLVDKAPHVLGYFYDLLNRPPSPRRKSDRLRLLVEKLNLRPFLRFLKKEAWDLVLNTHFLPAEIIASLRKKGELNTPQLMITTDFETHRFWIQQPTDHYFTATGEGKECLKYWGVPDTDISVTGIPVHPVFNQPKDRESCLKRLGLEGDRPIILQLAGGFGIGPVEKLFQGILSLETPLEVVVVAGRNQELKEELEKIEPPSQHRIQVMGFTDQIDELMAVSDVVVSKPGGLTTSEVLARGAVLAIVNPIPGQEDRNSDFILENGAGIKINNSFTLPYKLNCLLRNPDQLSRLKENARLLGKPQAAFEIAKKAIAWPVGNF